VSWLAVAMPGQCTAAADGAATDEAQTSKINQTIHVTPVAMRLKKLMPAIH
jgi:hypothetical protein